LCRLANLAYVNDAGEAAYEEAATVSEAIAIEAATADEAI